MLSLGHQPVHVVRDVLQLVAPGSGCRLVLVMGRGSDPAPASPLQPGGGLVQLMLEVLVATLVFLPSLDEAVPFSVQLSVGRRRRVWRRGSLGPGSTETVRGEWGGILARSRRLVFPPSPSESVETFIWLVDLSPDPLGLVADGKGVNLGWAKCRLAPSDAPETGARRIS